jgi:hypothetical protein
MIYLFDDTSDLYISKYINTLEFTDVLVHVSAVSGREVKLMEPSLRGAEWIFIHKSFKDSEGGPREVYDYVVNDIADYGDEVPLILFSDEDRPEPQIDRDYKNLIEAYKKSVFYSRLSSFLENRRSLGEAKIDLLLYGAGVEVEKVTESGGRILTSNRTKADNDIISLDDFSAADMMYVINSARPNIEMEYATLMQLIEQGRISARTLRRNINGIIESFIVYGTNIHHWE